MTRAMLVLSFFGVLFVVGLAWFSPVLFPWVKPAAIVPETRVIPVVQPTPPVVDPVINERPLFWLSRRAEAIKESEVDTKSLHAEAFPSELILIGLYRSGFEAGVILKSGTSSKRISQGGLISGWTLLNASDGRAEFLSPSGKDIHELKMQRMTKSKVQKKPDQSPLSR